MKIEKISEDIIKVTLFLSDMAKWNVSYDTFLPQNADDSEIFWDIIHKITEETGVKFENCRIVIEAMQKDEDTYVMLITKKKPERYKYQKKKNFDNDSVMVYSFKNINDISDFAINNVYYCFLFDGKNSIFKDKDEIRLVVKISDELKPYLAAFNDRISEYANILKSSELYVAYIEEYGQFILKNNALKTIYYKF